ncbi:DUF2625 domain-containing protein [Streptomonospora litoralis]|uniref:DUF2625 domain-containing protein n=1 Tax=Streptomonospora litoralis TaxID=2498135 RepID=A0A4P6QAZ6_9ACTN|nr:DUF2625 domain-containing protein [Streptomonospora litoralis]QBI56517.1 hypothetical protein EKD16_23855 [Streptomonospora litoralis]
MRALGELIDVPESAWPALEAEIASSSVPVRVLPADRPRRGRSCLLQLQVTVRSALGAIALHSGGLLVDCGWLRVFGGAGAHSDEADQGLPGLAQVNGFPAEAESGWRPEGGLVVAHDVLGGVFAINGPDAEDVGRPGDPGEMSYFAPDTLEWEPLKMGHGAWLSWALSGGLERFYSGLRWPGWREEVGGLSPSHGISVYPYLWSAQAQEDIAATSRRPVPMAELIGLNSESTARIGVAPPGFLGCHQGHTREPADRFADGG